MKTLYEILGIQRTATPEQITKAYRKLAIRYHPDVAKGDKEAAAQKFREIQEAYDVLSDPERRKLYDETGSTVPPGKKQDGVMASLLNLQRQVFEQNETLLSDIDVFSEMRNRIKSGMKISMQEKLKAEKQAHRFRLAAGRMMPEAENPFREAALNMAHQAEERAKLIDMEFSIHRDALAALERFSMRQEPETSSMFRPSLQWNLENTLKGQ